MLRSPSCSSTIGSIEGDAGSMMVLSSNSGSGTGCFDIDERRGLFTQLALGCNFAISAEEKSNLNSPAFLTFFNSAFSTLSSEGRFYMKASKHDF